MRRICSKILFLQLGKRGTYSEITRRLVELNGFEVLEQTDDLYGSGMADPVRSIKTYYETQWLARGKTIKLLSFRLHDRLPYKEPVTDDIERDDYRSMPRHSQLPVSGH